MRWVRKNRRKRQLLRYSRKKRKKDRLVWYSLTHSLTYTHSLTHLHSLTNSFIHSLTHSPIGPYFLVYQRINKLLSSAQTGSIKDVITCLDEGLHVDSKNEVGTTALMLASKNGYKAVCELLITRGCNVDMQNKYSWTALMEASYNGEIPVVISLIKAGCDYSLRNKEGKSAMDVLREKHPGKVEEVQVSHSPTAVVTHSLI